MLPLSLLLLVLHTLLVGNCDKWSMVNQLLFLGKCSLINLKERYYASMRKYFSIVHITFRFLGLLGLDVVRAWTTWSSLHELLGFVRF